MSGNILDSLMADIDAAAPDHLAITGDMVNLAAAAEISIAAEWLKQAGDPRDVSLVPGNHDAYVPGAFKAICGAWRFNMSGDENSLPERAKLFPYLRRRSNVALIGVSTATATPPFMASGLFGPRQSRRFGNLAEPESGPLQDRPDPSSAGARCDQSL